MSLSVQRRLITWGYLIITTAILANLQGSVDSFIVAVLVFGNIYLTFRGVRIGNRLQKAFFKTLRCRNCGIEVDLMGLWKCGCGYTHDKPVHAFDRCRNCGREMSFFNCPKCDVSITV